MFFYVAFAALTAINYRIGLIVLSAAFIALASTHGYIDNYYAKLYSNPIILEFVLGALIAKLPTPESRNALKLTALGFCMLLLGAYLNGPEFSIRAASVGIGAAIIIYGASLSLIHI